MRKHGDKIIREGKRGKKRLEDRGIRRAKKQEPVQKTRPGK